MKIKIGVLAISILLFAKQGYSQIADSILRANSANQTNTVHEAPKRAVSEIILDSLNREILVQAAKENPGIKSTAAYQTMFAKDNQAAIKVESDASETTNPKSNSSPH